MKRLIYFFGLIILTSNINAQNKVIFQKTKKPGKTFELPLIGYPVRWTEKTPGLKKKNRMELYGHFGVILGQTDSSLIMGTTSLNQMMKKPSHKKLKIKEVKKNRSLASYKRDSLKYSIIYDSIVEVKLTDFETIHISDMMWHSNKNRKMVKSYRIFKLIVPLSVTTSFVFFNPYLAAGAIAGYLLQYNLDCIFNQKSLNLKKRWKIVPLE
jgi:hypothetical protein